MKGYTFKISAQDQENVYREVLLPGDISFEDFHFAILDAFELQAGEMASFYLSNKNWTKKQEITLITLSKELYLALDYQGLILVTEVQRTEQRQIQCRDHWSMALKITKTY